ncbi:MAG: hypothetical protein C0404_07415 [Verrucomicrobia bacterium]|nr:hypothetical protein [Verrucomicrobiota bacterium]
MFLQPILLWALPIVLLPVIIHLMNRLRFKPVKWAAMMFVAAATHSSRKRAKLRHYLLLASRVLALLMLVLALSRPVTGGWMGGMFRSTPDTVILLLDRSASMEENDPAMQKTAREKALDILASVAGTRQAGRYVLIESAAMVPQEIADPSVLRNLAAASPSDTAANMPAMFSSAADYLTRNQSGRSEIWVASDMQRSNWRPESSEWQGIAARLEALPQPVSVKLLSMSGGAAPGPSLLVRDVIRQGTVDRPFLSLGLAIRSGGGAKTVPLTITLDGVRLQENITLSGADMFLHRRLDLQKGKRTSGWGMVELPVENNRRNNHSYFAYGEAATVRSLLAGSSEETDRRLARAAAPGVDKAGMICEIVGPDQVAKQELSRTSLVIWRANSDIGQESADALSGFVEKGGVLVCFPPGKPNVRGPFGVTWGEVETFRQESPLRAGTWEENDGPLAKTDNGRSLPVAGLAMLRRQMVAQGATEDKGFFSLCGYVDGNSFLLRKTAGRGQVMICTSLPAADWSNLGDGYVLVPMLQRMLQSGVARLSQSGNATCGEWRSEGHGDTWSPVDATSGRNPGFEAGVYQCGDRLVALNRPAVEDSSERAEDEKIRGLFGHIKVDLEGSRNGSADGHTEREIWDVVLVLGMLFLVAESLIMLGIGMMPAAFGRQVEGGQRQ